MIARRLSAFSIFTLTALALGPGCLLVAEEYPEDRYEAPRGSQGPTSYGSTTARPPSSTSGGSTTERYETDSFDPFGPDVTLEGSWAIDFNDGYGDRPASYDNCLAAGIDAVQLEIYDDTRDRFAAPSFLRFSCAQGSFSADDLVRHGDYYYRWVAMDGFGNAIGVSDFYELDVMNLEFVDTVKAVFNLSTPATSSILVELYWDLDDTEYYKQGTCYEAGVYGDVEYTLRDAFGYVVVSDSIGCTEALEFQNLEVGEYELVIDAYEYNDDWLSTWETTCLLYVDASGHSTAGCDLERDSFF